MGSRTNEIVVHFIFSLIIKLRFVKAGLRARFRFLVWKSNCRGQRGQFILNLQETSSGEQGWRSGESTRLPPMWPGFASQIRRHNWVGLLVPSNFSQGTQIQPTYDAGPGNRTSGPFLESPETFFGPEKPFVKLPIACFGKPIF